MVARSFANWFHQSEYTGENRCIPCTVLNVFLVAAGARILAATTTPFVGVVLFIAGITAIYFRGYVVPKTPTIASYLPDRVLTYFDHHETKIPMTGDKASAPDLEQVLHRAGAVEECEDVDDLCLTENFRTEWHDTMAAMKANESIEDLIRDALGDEVTIVEEEDELYAHIDRQIIGRWPSRTAAVADFASNQVLEARLSNWQTIDPGQWSVVARGLRPFLNQCPDCDGYVTAEKVTSCCISDKVQIVRHCSNCKTTFFESEPYTDLPESEI